MTETDQLDLFGPAVALGRHILAEEARDKRRRRPKARRAVPEPVDLRSEETRRRSVRARDMGIARVLLSSGEPWQDAAESFAVAWVGRRVGTFQASELRHASAGIVGPPPEPRAWGPVLLRLFRAGLIEPAGHEPDLDPKSHRSPANVWRPVKP